MGHAGVTYFMAVGSPFFVTGTVKPAATATTYGTPGVLIPPVPYTKLLVTHVSFTSSGVGTETLTTKLTVEFKSGAITPATVNQTSSQGSTDPLSFLEAIGGGAGGAGINLYGPAQEIVAVAFSCKSSIASSAAKAVWRLWGRYF